jgi:hypothetical protein
MDLFFIQELLPLQYAEKKFVGRNDSVDARETRLQRTSAGHRPSLMTNRSPFRYLKASPKIMRFAMMLYLRFPL